MKKIRQVQYSHFMTVQMKNQSQGLNLQFTLCTRTIRVIYFFNHFYYNIVLSDIVKKEMKVIFFSFEISFRVTRKDKNKKFVMLYNKGVYIFFVLSSGNGRNYCLWSKIKCSLSTFVNKNTKRGITRIQQVAGV